MRKDGASTAHGPSPALRRFIDEIGSDTELGLEDALKDALERYHSVLEAMGEGVVITDASGKILSANPASERIVGINQSDLPNLFTQQQWCVIRRDGSPFPPDDYPAATTLRTGEPCRGVIMGVYRPDGEFVWISVNTEPLYRGEHRSPWGVVVTFTDTTEYERALAARERSEQRLHLALNAARMGIWEYEPDANKVFWSPEVETLFGMAPGSFSGRFDDYLQRVHPEDRAESRRELDEALADPERSSWETEHRIALPDGSVRWIRGVGQIVRDEAGHALRMRGTVSDVSERKALEAQLLYTQKMESAGRIASGMAHDFNNLLAVIFGALSAARNAFRQHDEANFRSSLENIGNAAEKARDITGKLLSFASKQSHHLEVLEVGRFLQENETILVHLLREDIELVLRRDSPGRVVRVDSGQLQQVLLNLVANARDAMSQGGQIEISTELVQAHESGTSSKSDRVRINVSDTGPGIDDATKERLFEPFFTTKEQGTGLGLAMSYGIIRSFGGELICHSEPGKGTRFVIELPTVAGGTPAGDSETAS